MWSLRLAPAGEGALVATGLPVGPNGRPYGVTLIDTRRWTAKVLDPRASGFTYTDGIVLAYGGFSFAPGASLRGAGLSAYGMSGRRLYTLFAGQRIAGVQVVQGFLHIVRASFAVRRGRLLPVSRASAVFDVRSGRNLGKLSRPPARLLLVGADP